MDYPSLIGFRKHCVHHCFLISELDKIDLRVAAFSESDCGYVLFHKNFGYLLGNKKVNGKLEVQFTNRFPSGDQLDLSGLGHCIRHNDDYRDKKEKLLYALLIK